jgi:hypothetical protein
MNIHHPARVMRHKTRGQNPHETSQHHQGRLVRIYQRLQSGVKVGARPKVLVV